MPPVITEPKARDIMTADPVCVQPSTTIRELARILEENEISGVPVVDRGGALVGVVSKTDLIRRCGEGSTEAPPAYMFEVLFEQQDADETSADAPIPEPLVCVEDFMTEDPLTVSPDVPARAIASILAKRRIHRAIVVDQGRYPIGIITSLDLLAALAT